MMKEIRVNAFDMNCIGHIQHGMWTHPRDRSTAYNTIEYWQDLARLAERGKFDGIFLADIVGVYDVYRGGPAPSITDAVQIPVNDPVMVVPVMAAVTEHIGFGVTANLTYEPPYLFARRMSTLDHLTRGRIGWNIVTGYLDSAARGMGLDTQPDHDGRYDAADEYMSVVYKLWEASWEDGAVLRDKSNKIFADPTKIHRVRHQGRHYQLDAIHLAEPSPQRTPVLYQAGSSTRGREFAATHAECVFVFGADKRVTRDLVADIRARAEAHGRDPGEILIFYNRAAVVGRTRREAEDKYREYHEHASIEGALAHFSSSTGIDFSRYEPDEPIRYVKNDAINSAVETLTTRSAEPWTLRCIIGRMELSSRNPAVVGSAEGRRSDRLGRGDRYRRLQFESHCDPREPRGLRRLGGADPAGARRLQARLPTRLLAREAVRPLSAAAAQPPGRRTSPARRQQRLIQVNFGNPRPCTPSQHGKVQLPHGPESGSQ